MVQSTDRRFVRELNSLVLRGPRERSDLDPPPAKPALPASSGVSFAEDSVSASGAGIASPLTEQSRTEAIRTLVSDDGLVEIDVADALEMTFLDAGGREIVFEFSPPA